MGRSARLTFAGCGYRIEAISAPLRRLLLEAPLVARVPWIMLFARTQMRQVYPYSDHGRL